MKRILSVVLAMLLIGAIAAPAFAWEFSLKGEQEWRFRYFTRCGPNDLFGRNGTGYDIGFAGQNIYGHINQPPAPLTPALATPQAVTAPTASPAGLKIVRGGFSFAGPDAFYNDSRLTLYPEIRVNPAIRTFGVYNIGGYRNKYRQWNDVAANLEPTGVGVPPYERYYMHQSSPNAYDTAAVGSWEQFRFTVQTPWAIWSLGIKDFPFGIGASLSNNVRAESFFTVVPYGPFRFMLAVWSAQNAVSAGWGVNPDPDTKPTFYEALAMQYESGPWDMGAQVLLQKLHIKKLYQNMQVIQGVDGPPAPRTAKGYDRNLLQWIGYFKYNNGRFFTNAELAWFTMDKYFIGAAPQFVEAYHWFAEAGCIAGPARLTLMATTSSGFVLNNNNPTKKYYPYVINYQAMQPYEWLMFSTYGGGNQQFGGLLATDDGTGQMGDGFAYAARLDYAVAANLNVWGSYIWAHRLEKNGFAFGSIYSDGTILNPKVSADLAVIGSFARIAGRQPNGTPNSTTNPYAYGFVTDGFIGWEVNAGVDWKLLENLTATVRWAYWQPGEFFKEAYQARLPSANGGLPPVDTDTGKEIGQVLTHRDAIQAMQTSLIVSF
jgi:hypothetical protein